MGNQTSSMQAISRKVGYRIVNDERYREWIYERGKGLVEYAHSGPFQTIVFVDRGARPIYWLFEQLWQKMLPEVSPPSPVMLRVGHEKRLRDVYMQEGA